jgi:glucose/arabinose dehydrogenase/cytochrome c2
MRLGRPSNPEASDNRTKRETTVRWDWLLLLSAALTAPAAVLARSADTSAEASAAANTLFWVEELATGLKNPASMVWLPDGRILIAERNGGVRIFRKGALLAPISGTPASFQNLMNGLKEIVLDPDFTRNRTLYILLSEGDYNAHHAAVYRARLEADRLVAVSRIYRSKDDIAGPMQIAGRMIVLNDGTLLIGVTDDNYHRQYPQLLTSDIGKMVRINRDGCIPADNPFRDRAGALPEIWAYGNRVNNGLFQDPVTGEIWGMEPGPKGGDEMNLLKRGGNFGWPVATWGFDYTDGSVGPHQTVAGMESPLVLWTPSSTPAGMTRYSGHAYPGWDGDYFIGMLSGKRLERVRLANGAPVLQERLLLDLDERIRDVRQGPDGLLYVLTDHHRGRLLRLVPGEPPRGAAIAHKLDQPNATPFEIGYGEPAKGEIAFRERCAACHSFGERIKGGNIGPDLASVADRKAGSLPGFAYSAGMAALPQNWNIVSLNLFLADPQGYVPGTTMAGPPVDDLAMRNDIVGFLTGAK